ncbi:MAG: hypothetical protein UW88_C0020G0018, partial [Candidatus Collierbacteria bacterium GW2011_GWD2_45_10]
MCKVAEQDSRSKPLLHYRKIKISLKTFITSALVIFITVAMWGTFLRERFLTYTLKLKYEQVEYLLKANNVRVVGLFSPKYIKDFVGKGDYKLGEETLLNLFKKQRKPALTTYEIKSIRIEKNTGYVTRVKVTCYSDKCDGDDKKTVDGDIRFTLIGGKWYWDPSADQQVVKTENTIQAWYDRVSSGVTNYCTKEKAYKLEPEFDRATSLVVQRLIDKTDIEAWDSGKDPSTNNAFLWLYANKNCLDVSYASSVEEMSGAEGLFYFTNEFSNRERLRILVSPLYKEQDDLLTATLLSHEFTHAIQFMFEDTQRTELSKCYAETDKDFCSQLEQELKPHTCIFKEGEAFMNEINFLYSL